MADPEPTHSFTITIDARFNGPPGMGHGGYSCGLLAQPLSGAVEVTLRRPVPLERPLTISVLPGGKAAMHDGETQIAEARETSLQLEVLPAPGWEESQRAAKDYPGFAHHPYPTCYGCGTERGEGDGLRIFSGPRSQNEGWAAPWRPHRSLGGGDGTVPAEIVWAALDCPSGWVSTPHVRESHPEGTRIVTGKLACRIDQPIRAERPYTTLGWLTGRDGRKIFTATAIYDEGGFPVAVGTATWITLPPEK